MTDLGLGSRFALILYKSLGISQFKALLTVLLFELLEELGLGLRGSSLLPQLIHRERVEVVRGLHEVHKHWGAVLSKAIGASGNVAVPL